jgi:uncharacterized membrane protein YdbT with pleckstrin-like domain
MSYVENNLMSGERIIYKASIHWFIFIPGIIFTVLAFFIIGESKPGDSTAFFGVLLFLFGVISLLNAFITRISTELAITSKRVIAKIGLIRRKTIELNHSKVESFNVDQSIFGRIFGYGTIVVNGTGGGKTPISSIDSPLDFRRQAMEAIDQNQHP